MLHRGLMPYVRFLQLSPDLIFLDVQMPNMDGFRSPGFCSSETATARNLRNRIRQVCSVHAFDVHAVDYLLKPFDEERFQKALNPSSNDFRQGNELAQAHFGRCSNRYETTVSFCAAWLSNPLVRIIFVRSIDVDWLEASGNYVTLHVGRESHLFRTTMNALKPKLDPEQFVRFTVGHCKSGSREGIAAMFHGEQLLLLKDGTKLSVGRGFRARLETLLQNEV